MATKFNRDLIEAELDVIEALIDAVGVQAFLEGLSTVAGRKAQHIAEAWQDASLAKHWANLEGAIGVLSTKAEGL